MASEAPHAALSGLFWAGLLAAAATVPVSRLRRPLDLGAIDDHLELVLAGA